MRTHWIINNKTKTYVVTESETFDGEWKENYLHTKGADWLDVSAESIWEHDRTPNGIYYVYDLCYHGGMFTLLTDKAQHTPEDIKIAKAQLRCQHDVVSLSVLRLTKAETPSFEGSCRGWSLGPDEADHCPRK